MTPLCRLAAAGLYGASLTLGLSASAAPALRESYDGPTPTWRLPDNPGAARIIAQQRIRTERDDSPAGVEQVRFACPTGYSGVFLHNLGNAPILEEWQARLSFRGDRPGAQLAVQVVFPTKGDAGENGPPIRSIVRGGDRYDQPDAWQTLSLGDLPTLIKRQARMLRTQGIKQAIDESGAYVDSVALIVPGGERGAEFWTDELVVEGVLVAEDEGQSTNEHSVLTKRPEESHNIAEQIEPFSPAHGFQNGGKAFFPIVVSWQGEPLKVLRDLGFNTVALPNTPSPEQLTEARELELRLICPAPAEGQADEFNQPESLETMIAWTMPASEPGLTLDSAQPLISRVRGHSALTLRPLLAKPASDFAAWSRLADGLLLPAGTSPLAGDRFVTAASQASPGTPLLAHISLTKSPQAEDQLRALAPTGKATPWQDAQQIESAAWSAIAAGAQGLWFESSQPLGGAGSREERATAAIGLLNLQLSLIDPWLVAGELLGSITGPQGGISATLFHRGRTKLVLFAGHDTSASERSAGLVLPSISETSFAYTMTPAGLARIPLERTLGGMAIDKGALASGAPVLLTDDRVAVRNLGLRINKTARQAVTLQQKLAEAEMRAWRSVTSGSSPGRRSSDSPITAAATRWISQSKAAQATGDYVTAYNACLSAREMLSMAEQEFKRKLNPKEQLISSPLIDQPETWPDEFRLRELLRALPRSGNLLAGGDFEDLQQLQKAGWRHTQTGEGLGDVTVTGDRPAHGLRCLELTGKVEGRRATSWIVSPATPLKAGQLIEITGWVRVTSDQQSGAWLAIVDSLGGEELAVVVEPGEDWRPFRIIRRPSERAALRLTFAMLGEGVASVDAVMIRPVVLDAPSKPRTIETATGESASSNQLK